MIGWSKYRLGLLSAPLHYGLTWPVGIPTVFQTPVAVLLHSPNGRQIPGGKCLALGLFNGTVKQQSHDEQLSVLLVTVLARSPEMTRRIMDHRGPYNVFFTLKLTVTMLHRKWKKGLVKGPVSTLNYRRRLQNHIRIVDIRIQFNDTRLVTHQSQRTCDVIITSLLSQNHIAKSFWRYHYVIVTFRWDALATSN